MVVDVRISFKPNVTSAELQNLKYWIVHQCKIDVDELYNPRGRYRYWKGLVRI